MRSNHWSSCSKKGSVARVALSPITINFRRARVRATFIRRVSARKPPRQSCRDACDNPSAQLLKRECSQVIEMSPGQTPTLMRTRMVRVGQPIDDHSARHVRSFATNLQQRNQGVPTKIRRAYGLETLMLMDGVDGCDVGVLEPGQSISLGSQVGDYLDHGRRFARSL